ncbi:MAG: HisA/HisF-related TIM barrel protein, partial [Chloroflexota bacterium]|nr:HisA/HisF-related TIM barrel protein [Chloroflexota bacterium]
LVVTDIRRDGTGQGPNIDALTEMVAALVGPLSNGAGTTSAGVIASGGVGSLSHLEAVAATGAAGVIVGTAIYDGRVDLAEALALGGTLSPDRDVPSGVSP